MNFHKFASEFALPLARIWVGGEPRSTLNGQPLNGVYESSFCSFSIPTEVEDVVSTFVVLRKIFSNIDQSQKKTLSTEGVVTTLFCSVEQGALITIQNLKFLTENRINLAIHRSAYD